MSSVQQTDFSWWSTFGAAPVAAGTSIVPTYYGFAVKTAQQLGQPVPRMTLREALIKGIEAAPSVSLLVGTQMVAQPLVEKGIKHVRGTQDSPATFGETVASSGVVGVVTSPFFAAFNGKTAGQTYFSAVRNLRPRQVGAAGVLEAAFVTGVSAGDHVQRQAQEYFGDNPAVQHGSHFVSGAVGGLFGHPADTLFTRWNNGLPIVRARQLMRGGPVRAASTGAFSTLFTAAKDYFTFWGK